jgi:hypothetical protein
MSTSISPLDFHGEKAGPGASPVNPENHLKLSSRILQFDSRKRAQWIHGRQSTTNPRFPHIPQLVRNDPGLNRKAPDPHPPTAFGCKQTTYEGPPLKPQQNKQLANRGPSGIPHFSAECNSFERCRSRSTTQHPVVSRSRECQIPSPAAASGESTEFLNPRGTSANGHRICGVSRQFGVKRASGLLILDFTINIKPALQP